MKRSFPTRFLHLLLAAAIVHQLVVSLFMEAPRGGRLGDTAFDLHQYVGVGSMGIIFLFWIWTLVRRREHHVATLVPWLSSKRRRAVFADLGLHLSALKRFELPLPGEESPLVSAVHGLGLIAATAMAATGTAIFFLAAPDGSLTGYASTVLDLHSLLASLMWVYVIAHAATAVLHQISGQKVLQRMFGT